MESFVVNFWSNRFYTFKYYSLHQFLKRRIPRLMDKGWVDIWVGGNLLFSILCVTVFPLKYIFLVYGCYRSYELIIVLINLLLFDQFRAEQEKKKYFIEDIRRTVLLLMHNYLEVIFWFALIYQHFPYLFKAPVISLDSALGSLYFSLVTMTTLGYGDITPQNPWGTLIVIIQTLIGIFMALLLLARFIALLPKPAESKRSKQTE